ncbi:LPS export ABC transporter periplasmic protein LptC [Turicimonas muris]|uniref:LPS export ABC transporter periplasmic protein LptC n=1 Tax=Turicimonas muris TaxID=1796652 RepID=UPI00248C7993|nr:LPS export ABC transporter periplasmic protein LptC [Turicimonas muris]
MRDRLTSIIAVALLLTLVGMSYWYSVKAEMEGQGHLSDLNSPDFIAHDITVTKFDKSGGASYKVFAKRIDHYSDGHATAEFPEYYSLNPNEPQVTARSDSGEMVSGGETLHFYNNVDIRQQAHGDKPASRLETSQLDAYPDEDVYSSDKPVTLTRGSDISKGIGMDFDNVERTFKLRSRVQSEFMPRSIQSGLNKNESQASKNVQ